ncbi:MAG: MarR family transcriptional regulator [Devosia nanyangense]|nr:MarR family transcriptional regulator [Devosia nanyangense]
MQPKNPKEATIGYLVHEVARLFRRRFETFASEHGVTLTQWRALAQIHRQPSISQVALAGAIDSDPMTMSGVLERLERRGLVERYPDPDDSRAKLARLTAEGEELVRVASDVGQELHALAITGLSEEEKSCLTKGLTHIRDNLQNTTAE